MVLLVQLKQTSLMICFNYYFY